MNAMRQAHADGWFIVFDTLTLADDRLEAFYDNPNALRDYFRDIGRMVLAAEGRKVNYSHVECYQSFCVLEFGTANARLQFHAVLFFQAEDGIRDLTVTGVQTCALPICDEPHAAPHHRRDAQTHRDRRGAVMEQAQEEPERCRDDEGGPEGH